MVEVYSVSPHLIGLSSMVYINMKVPAENPSSVIPPPLGEHEEKAIASIVSS